MAKHRRKWSYRTYLSYIREGRGQGEGRDYLPWITIHDFASKGSCSRVLGNKTGRIHHLLSHLESDYFFELDANPSIIDIREQFPIPLDATLKIASDLNIRHPFLPGSSFPFVVTTDFLITRKDRTLWARAVKFSSDLDDPRTVEKLSIEYAYWRSLDVDWKLVTEKQISRIYASNLQWLRYGHQEFSLPLSDKDSRSCEKDFLSMYRDLSLPFPSILQAIEEGYHLDSGMAMSLFKDLIIRGQIELDLRTFIDKSEPRIKRKEIPDGCNGTVF